MILGVLLLFFLFVFMSAFFSGCETGLYSASKVRINVGAESGEKRYKNLLELINEPAELIFTILTGNNIATLAVSWCGTFIFSAYWPENAELINTCAAAPLLFIFGEVVPKTLFLSRPEPLMLKCSYPLLLIHRFLGKIRIRGFFKKISGFFERIFDISSDNEYYRITSRMTKVFDATIEEGYLSSIQRSIISRTSAITRLKVSQVMIRKEEIVSVSIDAGRDELLEIMQKHPFTRLPVYRINRNDMEGYVNIYELLSKPETDFSIAGSMLKIHTYNTNEPVISAMKDMNENGRQIALVEKAGSKSKRIVGLITLKDLAEELTGELEAF
ncbi:gliding motility-associated protein GldE [Sedimentisphaera cyanobacteriorum]|uniref:Gliding motility-associated protein GldE n=1 Tax=Sedimentisphaera cyanobacteriorum TaxID=1940790 RepID=A0A1Q2HLQ4_9BACT|nr:CNNM domain-containing protein [Sedimentisphaera cyanobacteriorum]AQQ08362.1 gliding motility-associated protein GldE [Sedimentisphaera cyanobacteriorum]